MPWLIAIVAAMASLYATPSAAQVESLPFEKCFESAATRYGVDKRLLVAIAKTESDLNAQAVSPPNVNGTHDIGMMQVNSTWLPTLAKYGITREDLLTGCTSIYVGAWILSDNINRHGPTWRAVGAYNASTPSKQASYVSKVQVNYELVGRLVAAQ